MKIAFCMCKVVFTIVYMIEIITGLKAENNNLNLKGTLNSGSAYFFKMSSGLLEEKKKNCGISKLNFSFTPSTSYSDFLFNLKQHQLRLNNKEMKQIYSVLDHRNLGYFTRSRWDHFVEVFLNNFITCDQNTNCGISEEELKTCIDKIEDFKVIKDYASQDNDVDSLIKNVIRSLDMEQTGEINLNSFINFKRMFVGFKNNNLNNQLDKELFMKAFKLSYNDYALDKQDLDLIFKVGSELVSKNTTSLSFADFFEVGRITSSYLSYGIPISQGYLTYNDILNSQHACSKMNSDYFKRYFSVIVGDDKTGIYNAFNINIDTHSLRFQDFFTLEYWANWFDMYSETDNMGSRRLNNDGFANILKDKLKENMKRYLAFSNFEDEKSFKYILSPMNVTDMDFLLGKSFLELESANNLSVPSLFEPNSLEWKKSLDSDNDFELTFIQNKVKSHKSVFSFMKLEEAKAEELNNSSGAKAAPGEADQNKVMINELFLKGTKNYYVMLDLYDDKYIYFEAFISFIKYIQVFDYLNRNNTDIRGVINSDITVLKPELTCHPPLSFQEQARLANLYTSNCNSIDFLYFVDYMISDLVFKPYINDSNKNFIDEVHLLLGLKKLNLYTPEHDYTMTGNSNKLANGFDYNSAVSSALMQRCNHNAETYAHLANPKFNKQFDDTTMTLTSNSTTNSTLEG